MALEDDLARRLDDVRRRIAAAAARSGRTEGAVRLVAVSKTHPVDSILAAAALGQRDFGENRVQEALSKIQQVGDPALHWHLVGHLQANKARKAAAAFAAIHSIDRAALLDDVDHAARQAGAAPELLVQVDLAGEPTKHGAPVEAVRGIFEAATRCVAARVVGLMLLPPFCEEPEQARPFFRRLRALRDDLAAGGVPMPMLGELSMGMSHDFEVAIEEGATIVRVGTAIFGERPPRATEERR